ncbi:S8 family peptidase [Massilia sp. PAMC28688]|uniref:S8 family peptidase n=1 Tax=Massilia sp. PAMC28688 TaxID=2861283 RepID=UPI001C626960|nr:S8 family peptidase [Massilia sp. PAMC28688]QYF93854.1 S8 family peptidase [Massilia sp. PAMC28688]
MKQSQLNYPTLLKMAAAVMLATGPMVAVAGMPDLQPNAAARHYAADTDRMIVKYRAAATSGKQGAMAAPMSSSRMAFAARAGQQLGVTMKAARTTATGAQVFELDRKMSVKDVAALAADLKARDPSVEYAEPDRMLQALMTPTDSRYNEQWHYFEAAGGLRLPAAWDQSTGVGVTVAVIDTGFRPHPDLAANLLPGYDFISNASVANDGGGRDADATDTGDSLIANQCGFGRPAQNTNSSWHGTHVAGTIAARTNNGVGVAGVAFNAKVVPARVLGKCGGYTSDIADAIIWSSGGAVAGVPANANPARVINLSLGGPGTCDTTTQTAINGARARGSIVIVAAGNDNTDASGFTPANCAGVTTVAAVNRSGGRAWYSNYGAVIDVAAPGGDTQVNANGILSTHNAGTTTPGADSYSYQQGTSMAAPHVAGVAALMIAKKPSVTVDELESRLKSTTRAFAAACNGCGTGVVDATAAVLAMGGTVTPPPPTTDPLLRTEVEPNNGMSSANIVATSGTTVQGSMGSWSDTDIFLVQLPPGKTLSSTLIPGSANADYDLLVYGANGGLLGKSENGPGATDAVSVTNYNSTTMARYVRVVYYSGGTGAVGGKYSLKLSW